MTEMNTEDMSDSGEETAPAPKRRGRVPKPKEVEKELPLMPRATAVWLVENSSLTFEQIAEFCGLHPLEVQGIADGEVAAGVRGYDPVANHQLTREELDRGQNDAEYHLRLERREVSRPKRRSGGPRYTPVAKRQEKPDAIAWLLRNHSELGDSQIVRLIGTTKNTIRAIRDRSHWNSANLRPRDPVLLGLCTQMDLNAEVARAQRNLERRAKKEGLEINRENEGLESEGTAEVSEVAAFSDVFGTDSGDDLPPPPPPPSPRPVLPVVPSADAVFGTGAGGKDSGDSDGDGDDKPSGASVADLKTEDESGDASPFAGLAGLKEELLRRERDDDGDSN